MSGFVQFLKDNPYKIAAGIFVVGGALYLLTRPGGASNTVDSGYAAFATTQAQAVVAGTQLQAAQIAGQVKIKEFEALTNIAAANAGAQVNIAQLQASTAINNATAQADVAKHISDNERIVNTTMSTLQARVADNAALAEVEKTKLNTLAATTINYQNTQRDISVLNAPYELAAFDMILKFLKGEPISNAPTPAPTPAPSPTTAPVAPNGASVANAFFSMLGALGIKDNNRIAAIQKGFSRLPPQDITAIGNKITELGGVNEVLKNYAGSRIGRLNNVFASINPNAAFF